MPDARLTPLDASFLEVETPTAHMHVGWAAVFERPEDGRECGFAALHDHIASRLCRAPRYMQKLADVPFDVADPVWVDDDDFRPERHIRRSPASDLGELVHSVMSVPLERDRPLWEMWIADRLDDGRVGLVGKAHHCMVDGLAAVELSTLLLDADPDPEPPGMELVEWEPEPTPDPLKLLVQGAIERAREGLALATLPVRIAASPQRLKSIPAGVVETAGAVSATVLPIAPRSPLNQPSSSQRHLASVRRPLDELREIKGRHGTTVNDVLLAACTGGLREYMLSHGDEPMPLKTMVPVSVRGDEEAGVFGNRISFMFVELPCDEPEPVERLRALNRATSQRKQTEVPERYDAVVQALGRTPRTVQHVISRLAASPRMFNLAVSNIPGPRERLYMNGCELKEAYPVVPLPDEHALSIGMTTIQDDACFGLYADRRTLPDVDLLAREVDRAVDELLELEG